MSRFIIIACLIIVGSTQSVGCDSSGGARSKPKPQRKKPVPVKVEDTQPVGKPFAGTRRIPIPQREHGYNNFNSIAIITDEEYRTFVEDVEKQQHWNAKEEFLSAMQSEKVDFNKELLLLIRTTSGSGSFKASLEEPTIDGDLLFRVVWRHPGDGTKDMNYQCFAVVVPKGVASQARIIRNFVADYEPKGLIKSELAEVIEFDRKAKASNSDGLPASGIREIQIPDREYGYNNFGSMMITSDEALKVFLDVVEKESRWNQNKEGFVTGLRNAQVDYDIESLVLVRITSGSGSTRVSLASPVIEGNDVVFRSIWKEPTWLTADMAYYCYARVVPNDTAENVRITTKYRKDVVLPLPKMTTTEHKPTSSP